MQSLGFSGTLSLWLYAVIGCPGTLRHFCTLLPQPILYPSSLTPGVYQNGTWRRIASGYSWVRVGVCVCVCVAVCTRACDIVCGLCARCCVVWLCGWVCVCVCGCVCVCVCVCLCIWLAV